MALGDAGMTERMDAGKEDRVNTAEFLGHVDLFKHLERDVLEGVGSRMRMVYLLEGHIIQDNGPPGAFTLLNLAWPKSPRQLSEVKRRRCWLS